MPFFSPIIAENATHLPRRSQKQEKPRQKFRKQETLNIFAAETLHKGIMNKRCFQVVLTDEAFDFIEALPKPASDKVYYNINRVADGEINTELFKKLENSEIWEFRTLYNGIAYRLFAFWDTRSETLVIATHGIIKKTQKTPTREIAKAERIRAEYFNQQQKIKLCQK